MASDASPSLHFDRLVPHAPRLRTAASDSPYGHVTHALGIGIVRGEFAEGSYLPGDAELLERFQVSRTVLREALKTLSAKGLIRAKTKVGTRVLERRFWNLFDGDILQWHVEAGAGASLLHHLSEMRLALEPEAAALACERRSEAQSAELQHWVDVMAHSRNAPGEFVKGDLQFHVTVAAASGNPFMHSICAMIEVALAVTFSISSPLPDVALHEMTVARHRAIADAIARRDPDAAQGAMRAVIREGMKRVTSVQGRGGDGLDTGARSD